MPKDSEQLQKLLPLQRQFRDNILKYQSNEYKVKMHTAISFYNNSTPTEWNIFIQWTEERAQQNKRYFLHQIIPPTINNKQDYKKVDKIVQTDFKKLRDSTRIISVNVRKSMPILQGIPQDVLEQNVYIILIQECSLRANEELYSHSAFHTFLVESKYSGIYVRKQTFHLVS